MKADQILPEPVRPSVSALVGDVAVSRDLTLKTPQRARKSTIW